MINSKNMIICINGAKFKSFIIDFFMKVPTFLRVRIKVPIFKNNKKKHYHYLYIFFSRFFEKKTYFLKNF